MTKTNQKDINEELKKLDELVYGDESVSSHAPSPASDDDMAKNFEEVTGDDPDKAVHSLNLAKEVDNDEKTIQDGVLQDPTEPETKSESSLPEDENVDFISTVSESLANSTQDPFDSLSDNDIPELKAKKTS